MKILNDGLIFDEAGFNVETVEYKNVSFTVWDVGGQDKVYTKNDILTDLRHC
jgi:hypothetical protein